MKKTGARRVIGLNIQAFPRNLQYARKCAIPKIPSTESPLASGRLQTQFRHKHVDGNVSTSTPANIRGVFTVKLPARCVKKIDVGMHRLHLPRAALCRIPSYLASIVITRHLSNAERPLPLFPRGRIDLCSLGCILLP